MPEVTSSTWDRTQLAVAEYTSLRAEIVQLTGLRTQLIGGSVVVFGVVLSVGFEAGNTAVVLVYPLLSLVLGIAWLYKAHLITRIAAYLRERVEGRVIFAVWREPAPELAGAGPRRAGQKG
ncbi:hypothetical protein C1I98_05040 [Spongiactinospora gelatinilytica]|uniref:Uncharacterized protein n=1 Tax=Spongiactinospora gelatinilytica TaxID=2666298 RepID=A0A2W2H1X5_9ACTN|nr:hypothetical protein [Spongiactinospora gelatinilytica]PZG53993.1 hypothetical protein C1I98_05040 [Spongiactinospora gelatinilytica]